jgi:valyl-tRNA synthetase
MARFIEMTQAQDSKLKTQSILTIEELGDKAKNKSDKKWVQNTSDLVKEITKHIDSYQFNFAADHLYEFVWHQFADIYIEDVKTRIDENSFMVFSSLFVILLKLLHPFMPFITEEIYGKLYGGEGDLIISQWPK